MTEESKDRKMSGEPKRRRGVAATKALILEAARELFTKSGYERVGVREIATLAGVDPALIIRYFHSKEKLFAEAVTQQFDINILLAGERDKFGERVARYILFKEMSPEDINPLLALLRSTPHEQGSLNEVIRQQFVEPLAAWLGGEQALLRAKLITAYLLGITVTQDLGKGDEGAGKNFETLVAYIAPVLQFYVDQASVGLRVKG